MYHPWPVLPARARRPLPGVGRHALDDWLDGAAGTVRFRPLDFSDDVLQPEFSDRRRQALSRIEDEFPGRRPGLGHDRIVTRFEPFRKRLTIGTQGCALPRSHISPLSARGGMFRLADKAGTVVTGDWMMIPRWGSNKMAVSEAGCSVPDTYWRLREIGRASMTDRPGEPLGAD